MSDQPSDSEVDVKRPEQTVVNFRDWATHWATVRERTGKAEYLRQVERTRGGIPVPYKHVEALADVVIQTLQLTKDDALLDLCCGNGLITRCMSENCRHVLGLDFSGDLLEVARSDFSAANIEYLLGRAEDVVQVVGSRRAPLKVCINSGVQHFTPVILSAVLRGVADLSNRGATIFCTDVPDVTRIYDFYNTVERRADLNQRRSAAAEAVGTWWSLTEIETIGREAGYRVDVIQPDSSRDTAHYRVDLLFTPG